MQVTEASGWVKVGGVQQKLYASGDLVIVRRAYAGWTAEHYTPAGRHHGYPVALSDMPTEEEVKAALDARFGPQPELILGGEKEGCDWTFYRHGNRAAWVRTHHSGINWEVMRNDWNGTGFDTRTHAEAAARKYVLGD